MDTTALLYEAETIVKFTADAMFRAGSRPMGQALRWRRHWERQCVTNPGANSEARRTAALAHHEKLRAESRALYELCMNEPAPRVSL
jgi:hypothetical protein